MTLSYFERSIRSQSPNVLSYVIILFYFILSDQKSDQKVLKLVLWHGTVASRTSTLS